MPANPFLPPHRYAQEKQLKEIRANRREEGLCIQCGVKTPLNPTTGKPYRLCGIPVINETTGKYMSAPGTYVDECGVSHKQQNCRGANNAAALSTYYRKQKGEPSVKRYGSKDTERKRRRKF